MGTRNLDRGHVEQLVRQFLIKQRGGAPGTTANAAGGNGAPNPLKPVHELLGEALLDAGRAQQALEMFDRSLLRTPNRPLSLLGLARAYAALGDRESAGEQYRKLAEVWKDRDFPALQEASTYLATRP